MTREEKIAEAQRMRDGGATYAEIGDALSVDLTTARYWLNPGDRVNRAKRGKTTRINIGKVGAKYSSDTKQAARNLSDCGWRFEEIAVLVGCSKSSVLRFCRPQYGIESNKSKKQRYDNDSEFRAAISESSKAWRLANRERENARRRSRIKSDLQVRLSTNLRARFGMALRKGYKGGSAVRDLGCSISDLIQRFAFFWPEYTWDKYGKEWEIDHIRPLSRFDLSDPEQVKVACNYANLRPLGSFENRSKGAKIERTAAYGCAV